MTEYSMKQWALAYANKGLAIFPLWEKSKKPMTANGCKDATADINIVKRWWETSPNANIGIATGSRSGGLVVIDLDIDEEKGKDGYGVFRDWEKEHGELPETWRSITGRGGYHLFYKDSATNRNKTNLYDGVDIRGEGGYVVAPPSVHPNGRRYEWEFSPEEFPLAEADAAVIEFLRGDIPDAPPQWEKPQRFQCPVEIPDGDRTKALISVVGSMKGKCFPDKAIRAAVLEINADFVPPLTEDELRTEVFPALKNLKEGNAPYYKPAGTEGRGFESFESFELSAFNRKDNLPSFPIQVFPEPVGSYIKAVTESLQVPVDMVAVMVLAILSLSVQGKYAIRIKPDWIETVNLYVLVVARPSERKSPTLKETMGAIFQYIQEENERREPDIAEYELKKQILTKKLETIKNGIAGAKKDKTPQYTMQDALDCQKEINALEAVTPLTLVVDDVTPEALAKIMKENGEKMAIVSAEGGMFGTMAGRYSDKPNNDIFLKSYAGEHYTSVRIGRRGEDLNHPLLTILIAAQPFVLEDVMQNGEFRGKGLLARFLYSIPQTAIGDRSYRVKPISDIIRQDYRDLVYELLNIPDMFGERIIEMSKEADLLSEVYNQWIEKRLLNEFEEIEDWAGKMHGNTMRVASLLHIIKHRDNIVNIPLEAETMQAAIEIGKYFLEHSKAAFDVMGLGAPQDIRDAKYILRRLRDGLELKTLKTLNTISKRDWFQLCRARFKTVEEMQPALQALIDHGYITIERRKLGSGGGRPTETIYFNPEYLASCTQEKGGLSE